MSRRCPNCETEVDAQTGIDGANVDPFPGDLSICLHCGVALRFTESLQLRLLDFVEWVQLSAEQREKLSRATALAAMYRLYGPRGSLQ